jgi:methionine-S-sulfoxide reductase
MKNEKALLGAGCFWGVDQILKKIEGITKTEVGYAGGSTKNPSYEEVCTGRTDHAEVVLIEFNLDVISYAQVLDIFFRLHDPTTVNRQHNDIGTQYRSVIFTYSDEQNATALEIIKKINESHIFKNPIVTQVLTAPVFYSAEAYHQDYLIKNPSGYMCHILRD